MDYLPAACELNDGNTVVFDIPWTEADDYDETWQVFQVFQSVVGA